jgi:RHS repeat-associated protein
MLNPTDWSYTGIAYPPTWLYRGYTGHEHLPAFHLINMNARLYDPYVGRMLSPDNYVQDPYNSQNLNRFSYALNNPIMFKDPDGNFVLTGLGAFVIVSSAFATAASGYIMSDLNGANPYVGAIAGMLVGGLTAGFGNVLSGATASVWWLSTLSGAGLGAVSSATMAYATGGSGDDVLKALKYGGLTGGISGFISSEAFINMVKGGKFLNNDDMLDFFVKKGDYVGAMKHFRIRGEFIPDSDPRFKHVFRLEENQALREAGTNLDGSTYFNKLAFTQGYDHLALVNQHEGFRRVQNLRYNGDRSSYNNPLNIANDETEIWLRNSQKAGFFHKKSQYIFDIYSERSLNIINKNKISIYKIPQRW